MYWSDAKSNGDKVTFSSSVLALVPENLGRSVNLASFFKLVSEVLLS